MNTARSEIATLEVRLLGSFVLRHRGGPVLPLESARAESLLAYLVLHRDSPQPRERLAFLLWPDSTESQARTNLRHLLHNLRRALPDTDRLLEVTQRTLHWRTGGSVDVDLVRFEDALTLAAARPDAARCFLDDAVACYGGDLLAGRYDEWMLEERDRLRSRYLDTLERLTTIAQEAGDTGGAIGYAERLLRSDPFREEPYRTLMRLHAASGDRARALRVYHACATTLERELGVEPSAATRDAYDALLPPSAGADVRTAPLAGTLVGRENELAQLSALWETTESGRSGLVVVTGEAGAGKTRLIEEFRSWCTHRGTSAAEARSYSSEGALAYGVLTAWLRSDALGSRVRRLDRSRITELARLLPELPTDADAPQPLFEDEQRLRLFDAAAAAILAGDRPLLLVADDVQWCDADTLRFLHYLLRAGGDAPVLVAATARSGEIDHPHPVHELLTALRAHERCAEIELGRLSRDETAALAERLTGTALGTSDADDLYDDTEGNPLFVVEAMRAGWKHRREDGSISPKVQAVIGSRLAQLSPPARELLDVAATIGRGFTTDVLALAADAGEEPLVSGLDELWRRRIVRERGTDGYDFSHDKIREVAYLTLPPARRRHLHLRVARALERVHQPDLDAVSAQLAVHYERAGAVDRALRSYERAAEVAQHLHAHAEAVRLLERALELLRTLPETNDRLERELSILTALPGPLVAVEGYASEHLAEVHDRAFTRAAALGAEPGAPLLRSVAIASLCREDFASADEMGGRLRAMGLRDGDDVLVVEGDYVLGVAAFWRGRLADARKHLEAAVGRYRAEHRGTHLLRYGQDPQVVCLARLGHTLLLLGHPGEAIRSRDAALALADQIGHAHSRHVALIFAGLFAVEIGAIADLRTYVAGLSALRTELRATVHEVGTAALHGYLDVLDGRAETGIASIRTAMDGLSATQDAPGLEGIIHRLLVGAYAAAGHVADGLAVADRMLGLGGGAVPWEAEIRRTRALFLMALEAPGDEIGAELERALAVANLQDAAWFELRVATTMVRWSGTREAQDLLASIVARLPDAPDLADVRRARELLVERSRNAR